jgi:hypothetical protein
MNQNPYLAGHSQSEVSALISSGSIIPDIDSNANLVITLAPSSLYSSSITIPLVNVPVDPIKVETKYNVAFTEI